MAAYLGSAAMSARRGVGAARRRAGRGAEIAEIALGAVRRRGADLRRDDGAAGRVTLRGAGAGDAAPRARRGCWILGGGVAFPVVVLAALFVYAHCARSAVAAADRRPGAADRQRHRPRCGGGRCAIATRPAAREIVARQRDPPAGRPRRRLGLNSGDVIHSFWVPALAGKVDMVPGRVQHLRLRPSAPGTYRGQCAEFCGEQHARMALHVVVDPAPTRSTPGCARRRAGRRAARRRGRAARPRRCSAAQRCVACHAVRGLAEGGSQRPRPHACRQPRCLIGAGTLPPTTAGCARWVADVQQLKPGARMPSYDRLDARRSHALARLPRPAAMSDDGAGRARRLAGAARLPSRLPRPPASSRRSSAPGSRRRAGGCSDGGQQHAHRRCSTSPRRCCSSCWPACWRC